MLLVGITGGIATGKTFITNYLLKAGYKVFDADKCSRLSYSVFDIYSQIHNVFPDLSGIVGDELREEVAKFIFSDSNKLKLLENIIHPYVRNEMYSFVEDSKEEGEAVIFLDIPLLFEKNLVDLFDKIIVTVCSENIRDKRLYKRGYDDVKMKNILNQQIKQKEKEKLSDYVIDTSFSKDSTILEIQKILKI